jgi:flagellar export protein FliJ
MAFHFLLQTLLRFRRNCEHREKLQLAAINRQIVHVRLQMDAVVQEKVAARNRLGQNLARGILATELRETECFEMLLALRQESLARQLVKLEQLRREQQRVYEEAWRQSQILENLRDRQERLYYQEQARREQEAVDEQYLARRRFMPQS